MKNRQPCTPQGGRMNTGKIRNKKIAVLAISLFYISGCSMVPSLDLSGDSLSYEGRQLKLRKEHGDPPLKGYQPLDPILAPKLEQDILSSTKNETTRSNEALLRALPNESVRLAIGQADSLGNISFGTFTAKTKTGSYVVILDYIKYQTKSLGVTVWEDIPNSISVKYPLIPYPSAGNESALQEYYASRSRQDEEMNKEIERYLETKPYWVRPYTLEFNSKKKEKNDDMNVTAITNVPSTYDDKKNVSSSRNPFYSIPVYIGVGVRMVASVTVTDATVELGSLYGLAAGAQEKRPKMGTKCIIQASIH
jgi:hypothetical protein